MKEILNEVKNMVVKQISVFIENKEGRMKKAINTLAQENINIRALSIADTTKYGILRLIVSDNEKAIEALEKDGFIVREDDVIIVAVPDEPNGLNTTLAIFDEKGINLDYLYAFVSSKTEKAIVVRRLKHMDEAIALLKDSDAPILEKKFIEKTFSFLNLLQSKQFQYILLQNNKNHLLLLKFQLSQSTHLIPVNA